MQFERERARALFGATEAYDDATHKLVAAKRAWRTRDLGKYVGGAFVGPPEALAEESDAAPVGAGAGAGAGAGVGAGVGAGAGAGAGAGVGAGVASEAQGLPGHGDRSSARSAIQSPTAGKATAVAPSGAPSAAPSAADSEAAGGSWHDTTAPARAGQSSAGPAPEAAEGKAQGGRRSIFGFSFGASRPAGTAAEPTTFAHAPPPSSDGSRTPPSQTGDAAWATGPGMSPRSSRPTASRAKQGATTAKGQALGSRGGAGADAFGFDDELPSAGSAMPGAAGSDAFGFDDALADSSATPATTTLDKAMGGRSARRPGRPAEAAAPAAKAPGGADDFGFDDASHGAAGEPRDTDAFGFDDELPAATTQPAPIARARPPAQPPAQPRATGGAVSDGFGFDDDDAGSGAAVADDFGFEDPSRTTRPVVRGSAKPQPAAPPADPFAELVRDRSPEQSRPGNPFEMF